MRGTQHPVVVPLAVGLLAGALLATPWSAWSSVCSATRVDVAARAAPSAATSCAELRKVRFMGIAFREDVVPPADLRFVVDHVCSDSPASHAGIRRGDVVTNVNGAPVAGWRATIAACRRAIREGDLVHLRVWRDGRSIETPVDLADW